MKNRVGNSILMSAVLLAGLVPAGCGWTNDEKPPPSQRLEDSIRIYGLARAYGEAAQADLRAGKKVADAVPLIIRSQRHASHISGDEELEGEAAGFVGSLRDLTLEWSASNVQALKAARSGDEVAMRHNLQKADSIETQIDSLIDGTDLENIDGASISNGYANSLMNRDVKTNK